MNASILTEAGTKSLATCLTVPARQIEGDWCQWRRSIVRTHLLKCNNCHWHLPHWWRQQFYCHVEDHWRQAVQRTDHFVLHSVVPLESLIPDMMKAALLFAISKLESPGLCLEVLNFVEKKKKKNIYRQKEITVQLQLMLI